MSITDRRPRISVFIPAYNAEPYIADAIESVLAQTEPDFELLLIDDASTDATAEIMAHYDDDPRVRIVRHVTNQQRPLTRSHGVALASGQYIALLDADDRCAPDRLARQAAFLDTRADIDVVGSWWQRIDGDGRPLADKRHRRYLSPDAVKAWLLFRCVIHNPTVMARTAALQDYAFDPAFPIAEDYEVWARMVPRHRFAIMPEALTTYRHHAEQVSTARAADSLYYRQQVQARQLDALGIVYNAQDLRYHSLLYTGRRLFRTAVGHDMNLAYVCWAKDWLEGLVAANRYRPIYPPAALNDLAARLWWFVCRKAAGADGWRVWPVFWRSSLAYRLPHARLGAAITARRD